LLPKRELIPESKKVGQGPTSRNPEEGRRFLKWETPWNLRELAMMVHLDLTNLQRRNISARIPRDVHSCDFVAELTAQVSASSATLRRATA
jgi:hypothetical protein